MADSQLSLPSPSQDADMSSDEAQPSDNRMPFAQTILGRLPTELLERTTEYIHGHHLAAVSKICPKLRTLAEMTLYRYIQIPPRRLYHTNTQQIYQLNRTLTRRVDLARRTRELKIFVIRRDEILTANVARALLLNTDLKPSSAQLFRIDEATIVRNMLQSLPNLERLNIQPVRNIDTFDGPLQRRLRSGAIQHMFPNFDQYAAHITYASIFPKLQSLVWQGDEFHWCLARSPELSHLSLLRPCNILRDKPPEENNYALQNLALVSRSSVLNPDVQRNKSIAKFLSYFPALKRIRWSIHDEWFNEEHTDESEDVFADQEGAYNVLVELLRPVAHCLTTLDLMINTG